MTPYPTTNPTRSIRSLTEKYHLDARMRWDGRCVDMTEFLEQLGRHLASGLKKPASWISLGCAVLYWIVSGLLEHRFFAGLNDWADRHEDKIMEWIKDIVFSPSLFLVIVVCLILLKALIETSKKAKSSDREAIPMTISDSRLKIISAYYGVEGGPDANVADDYINPKIQGHSLAGWVGADLFGGFQPVIGREKRVKVRYSFDGVETTIERPEHALLVLPEDKFLKEQIEMLRRHLSAQVVITGLLQGDPELEISFSNDLQGALTVVNRGAEDIYGIRVFPIQTAARILNFD